MNTLEKIIAELARRTEREKSGTEYTETLRKVMEFFANAPTAPYYTPKVYQHLERLI